LPGLAAERRLLPRGNRFSLKSTISNCFSWLRRIVFLRPGGFALVPGLLPVQQARQALGGLGALLALPSLPSDRLQLASLPRRRR
jgi:hypothetical protein